VLKKFEIFFPIRDDYLVPCLLPERPASEQEQVRTDALRVCVSLCALVCCVWGYLPMCCTRLCVCVCVCVCGVK